MNAAVASYTTTVGRLVTVNRTVTTEQIPFAGTETAVEYSATCAACGTVYGPDVVTSPAGLVDESGPAGDAHDAARGHAAACAKGGAR